MVHIELVVVISLAVGVVQGLRIPAVRTSAWDSIHKKRGSFKVTRPSASSLMSTSVNAAITESNNTDLASVRDIVYMTTVTVANTSPSELLIQKIIC
jgi:hypothetical protein